MCKNPKRFLAPALTVHIIRCAISCHFTPWSTFRSLKRERIKRCQKIKLVSVVRCTALRLQEKLSQQETRFKEKSMECAELLKDLDELRIETNR